jgi:glycosyltransferase involved in cell wall biosynthesis
MCPRGQFLQTGVAATDEELWKLCFKQVDQQCATNCFSSRYGTGCDTAATAASTTASGSSDSHFHHTSEDIHYWTRWIERRMTAIRSAIGSIDAFIAPSVHLYQRFTNDFLPPEQTKNVLLLPYGFDRMGTLSKAKHRRVPGKGTFDNPYVLGYIGRHEAAKGVHLLIKAAHALSKKLREEYSDKHFKVIIYGRSNDATTASLRGMVHDLNLNGVEATNTASETARSPLPVVEFGGEYNNNEIVDHVFNHVDAIVVPSIWCVLT